MKGRKCAFKKEVGLVQTRKNIDDIMKKKAVTAGVRHKDEVWRNVSTLPGERQQEEKRAGREQHAGKGRHRSHSSGNPCPESIKCFSEGSCQANSAEVLTDSLIITSFNIIGTLWPGMMTLCSLCLVVKLKSCQRQHYFLQLLAHAPQ